MRPNSRPFPRPRRALRPGAPFVGVLVGVLVGALAGCSDRPNVLLISIDTLRADHLRAYGYERDTAPTIDRLAAEGVVFENAYAPEPATVGSHASLFTGRFPHQHGNNSYRWNELDDAETTMAEILDEAGYHTFAVASSVRFDPRYNLRQGFDDYESVHWDLKSNRGKRVTDRAFELMAAWVPGPYFGFLHYFGPHQPYDPPEPYRSKWHPGPDSLLPRGVTGFIQDHRFPEPAPDPEALAYLEARYDGEILYLDGQLERVLAELEERGEAEDTLVVLIADHGEEFRDHQGLGHSHSLHEELLRVPMIFWWPGRLPAGLRISRPVQLVDVLPTVLELARVEQPLEVPGRSLVGEIEGRPAPPGPDLVIAQRGERGWSVTATLPAGRFKLIAERGFPDRLFQLDADPTEQRDVIERHPDVAAGLSSLAQAQPGLVDGEPTAEAAPMPRDIRRQLRAIGYLDDDP